MHSIEHKRFTQAEGVREFIHGKVEHLTFDAGALSRVTLHPGWRWSRDNQPVDGTEWCENTHFGFIESGVLHVQLVDGMAIDLGPQEVVHIPPGHDAWVVGDKPVILYDWAAMLVQHSKAPVEAATSADAVKDSSREHVVSAGLDAGVRAGLVEHI